MNHTAKSFCEKKRPLAHPLLKLTIIIIQPIRNETPPNGVIMAKNFIPLVE